MTDLRRKMQEIKNKKEGKQEYQLLIRSRLQKLKFSGRMKNISLWIPLDATNPRSRVLAVSLMCQANYKKAETI